MNAPPTQFPLSLMRATIARLRQNLARPPAARRVADALASAFDRWRDPGFPARREAVAKIAAASGWSTQLLEDSLDALLAPFSRDALASFGSASRPRLGGFIMPANVPGAGMHELVATLISGGAALVKTSNREQIFFHAFATTLRDADPAAGS